MLTINPGAFFEALSSADFCQYALPVSSFFGYSVRSTDGHQASPEPSSEREGRRPLSMRKATASTEAGSLNSQVTSAAKITKSAEQQRIEQVIGPNNPEFVKDISEDPTLCAEFEDAIKVLPKDRTIPMPGMKKVSTAIITFIRETILGSGIDSESQRLYKELISELEQLEREGFPWNRSFILSYKAAHYISFFQKDFCLHLNEHKSKYLPHTTLGHLSRVQWSQALNEPDQFIHSLKKLWRGRHLIFSNSVQTNYKPLKKLEALLFPCIDEIGLVFFIKTWFYGVHPAGLFTDMPEILFDGDWGLCADFFEHDLMHSSGIEADQWKAIKLQFLLDIFKDNGLRNPLNDFDELKNIQLPDIKSLELVLGLGIHDMSLNLMNIKPEKDIKEFFTQGANCFAPDLQPLPSKYAKPNKRKIKDALKFLACLQETHFWDSLKTSISSYTLLQATTAFNLKENSSFTSTHTEGLLNRFFLEEINKQFRKIADNLYRKERENDTGTE
ncbi:hypothetical protein EOPP23_02210 [Endozoicomonas sp. OPT23]|uniref:hypothetical protein n=1 Tax=Endozoicomonas sp. OPT23 TaxID=2072845 RepID=UPI00129B08A1|nr:hypothetical protein [Endozoicomonas sp. OPT23]MRI31808.1 hypothetical protein [Endozoicomonas sp. OPT23]